MTALQLDMFAPPAPQLPVARVHPHNPRAFDVSDCYRERIDCDDGIVVTVIIARCSDGLFRGTAGYSSKTGGIGGPVFDTDYGSPEFGGARTLALLGLRGCARGASNAKVLKAIERISLDRYQVPA